jgi:hypothetical protein
VSTATNTAGAPRQTLTCEHCSTAFTAPTQRRGARARRFCTPKCQQTAANARRQTTREGRKGNLSTAAEPSGQPVAPGVITIPPTHSTPLTGPLSRLSDSPYTPATRLSALMALAHSKGGINPWQLAELARLRGMSPWAPARLIMSKDYRP